MRLRNVRRTNFEDQSTQGRAPGAAVEPKEEGVLARPALRRDEVVEELRAVHLVHFHVPTAARSSTAFMETDRIQLRAGEEEADKRVGRTLSPNGREGGRGIRAGG